MADEGRMLQGRMCVACRAKRPKQDLWRVERRSDGAIAFDPTGRLAGRGAYVCSAACLEQAQGRRGLERALRCRLTEEDYAQVAAGIASATKQDMRETEV